MKDELIVGRNYRVTFLPVGARTRTRQLEAKLIGTTEDQLIFSGRGQRREFGTATLHRKQIVKMEGLE